MNYNNINLIEKKRVIPEMMQLNSKFYHGLSRLKMLSYFPELHFIKQNNYIKWSKNEINIYGT